jgi:hypothetical protein
MFGVSLLSVGSTCSIHDDAAKHAKGNTVVQRRLGLLDIVYTVGLLVCWRATVFKLLSSTVVEHQESSTIESPDSSLVICWLDTRNPEFIIKMNGARGIVRNQKRKACKLQRSLWCCTSLERELDKLLECQIWLKSMYMFSRNRCANSKALCGVVSAKHDNSTEIYYAIHHWKGNWMIYYNLNSQ